MKLKFKTGDICRIKKNKEGCIEYLACFDSGDLVRFIRYDDKLDCYCVAVKTRGGWERSQIHQTVHYSNLELAKTALDYILESL